MTEPPDERTGARWLRTLMAAMAVVFGLVWAWVAAMPLAFLDPEYPFWHAKQVMLRDCDLDSVIVLGDSRAAAGIRAAELPGRVTNLAVGGGKPVEAYIVLKHALACPNPLRRVVLSFDAVHFARPDLLWERAVRFGFLDFEDLSELRATAAASGDLSLYRQQWFVGLPQVARDWLYAARFPPLYFASLMQGAIAMRWPGNARALAAGLASRGHYHFGTADGSDTVAAEGHVDDFEAAPVLDRYFDRILAALDARGVAVDFVSMPVNTATARAVKPAVRAGLAAYLSRYESRYPHFHVLGTLMPSWPNWMFGDEFSHLNPRGASAFTALLGRCLASEMSGAREACRFDWPPEMRVSEGSRPAE